MTPTDWKRLGAAVAAMFAAASAFVAGWHSVPQDDWIPRVSYLQIRAVQPFKVDAPGWRSWRARVTYKDESGRIQRDIPITVDVEAP